MTQLAEGMHISARVTFKPEFSDGAKGYFVFFYRITIENHNPFEVQLVARHWDIFDSNGLHTIVDGEGVVGEKPFLAPGESFNYESACNLSTGIGRMKGYYKMVHTATGGTFNAEIPEFKLEVAYMLN